MRDFAKIIKLVVGVMKNSTKVRIDGKLARER